MPLTKKKKKKAKKNTSLLSKTITFTIKRTRVNGLRRKIRENVIKCHQSDAVAYLRTTAQVVMLARPTDVYIYVSHANVTELNGKEKVIALDAHCAGL